MSATILFIGDQHFQINNIQEVEIFIEKMTNLAKAKKPTLIIAAGDLLDTHERLHTIPLNKAYEFLDNMRKIAETYVIVGNHDMINHVQFLNSNHWLNGIKEWKNITVVDTVVSKVINDCKFIFSPFVYPGRFEEALNTCKDEWKDAHCIFAHQEFFGCKMGAIISVEGDKWSLDYPNVISGHIHSHQKPQKNIFYPGSAMQHAFGESSKNIIAHLTFTSSNKTQYELEEIDLELPRKKIVYMDVENIDEYVLPETEDKIKITVSGCYDDFKALKKTKKYKKLIKDGIKVVFKPKQLEQVEGELEGSEKIKETTFTTILDEIINKAKDNYLFETYQLVINSKQIKASDVIYLE
jgi:DNA repair exonuclease SbcCD nuclease subunit